MFLPSAANIITSAIVIRMLVPEWWGQITEMQLYMYIATQFCAWGNKDALMKLFSENPSEIQGNWMDSLSSRLFLLLPVLLGVYFISTDIQVILHLSSWIILRFFMQAFEAPILFLRKFTVNVIAETVGLLVSISTLLIFRKNLSFNDVLLIITMGYFLKTSIQIFYFRSYFTLRHSFKPNYSKLKALLPFMMLGFAAGLQQKSDMICVVWMSTKIEVAQYQVFSSFLLFMQSFPGLIAGPFIKNLYRLPKSSYPKIQRYFVGIGLVISVIGTILTYLIVTYIYHFNLSFTIYGLGFLYGLLTYFYMLRIYLLFKNNKQEDVMRFSLLFIIINVLLCFLFIPMLNIEGAVLANVITQVLSLFLYQYLYKHHKIGMFEK
jgi:O-antigen/teichoic acid export membrane protein